jgi:SET domain-containing protein
MNIGNQAQSVTALRDIKKGEEIIFHQIYLDPDI